MVNNTICNGFSFKVPTQEGGELGFLEMQWVSW